MENTTEMDVKVEPADEDWQVTVERNEIITQQLLFNLKFGKEFKQECQVDEKVQISRSSAKACNSIDHKASHSFQNSKKLVVLLKDIRKCKKCGDKLPLHKSTYVFLKQFCEKCKPKPLKIEDGNGKVKCSLCLRVYKNISNFYVHLSTIHRNNILSYKCPECDHVSKSKIAFSRHKQIHKKNEYFKCNMCSLPFLHKSNLERHIRVKHIQENNYEKVKARHHANISNLLKDRFKCDLCNSSFKGKPSLYHHSRKYHGVELHHPAHVERIKSSLTADGYLQCKECGKKFNQNERFRFRDHASKHKLKTKYKCPNCEKRFPTLRDVEEHQWRHTGIKSYKCGDECGMTFPREHNLQSHLVHKHIKERNYECYQCHMKFITKLSLTRHMIRHTENRISYKCEYCDQSFLNEDWLKGHMLKRTNEVYKCCKCEKKYCNRKVRAQHLKSEHNIFECYVCGKNFRTNNAVTKHRKQHLKNRK